MLQNNNEMDGNEFSVYNSPSYNFEYFLTFNKEEEDVKSGIVDNLKFDSSVKSSNIYNNIININEFNDGMKNEISTFNIKTICTTNDIKNELSFPYISFDKIKNFISHNKDLAYLVEKFIKNGGDKIQKYIDFFKGDEDKINLDEIYEKDNANNNLNKNTNIFKVTSKRRNDLDEIILKIKSNLTKYIKDFINFLIKEKNIKTKELLPLKYELINRPMINNFNLNLLEKPIYQILANDISGKSIKNNYDIIMNLKDLKDEKYGIIKKALDLTWGDYLDIFRYYPIKKLQNKMEEEILEEIIKKFQNKVDTFIEEKKNDKYDSDNEKFIYLGALILSIYNYERYFILKKGRKSCENRKNKRKKTE